MDETAPVLDGEAPEFLQGDAESPMQEAGEPQVYEPASADEAAQDFEAPPEFEAPPAEPASFPIAVKPKAPAPATKQGTFLPGEDATRQQVIEYLSLEMWSGDFLCQLPFALLLSFGFLCMVLQHSHTAASFEVRDALQRSLQAIAADMTRGVSPERIRSEATDSNVSCSCACVPWLTAQERLAGGFEDPLAQSCAVSASPDPGAAYLQGLATPAQLPALRAFSAHLAAASQDNGVQIGWSDLRTIPDVWFWLQHGFLPEVWHQEPRMTPMNMTVLFAPERAPVRSAAPTESPVQFDPNRPGLLQQRNQVIGGIRMRQRRLAPEDCRSDQRIVDTYGFGCHAEDLSVEPFGPGETSDVEGFVPEAAERGAFDVYLDVERPVHMALETVDFALKAHDWLDAGTTSLTLQAAALNAEISPALFALLEVQFDFDRSGEIHSQVIVRTVTANPYPTLLSALPEVVFGACICWIVFRTVVVRSCRACCKSCRSFRKPKHDDFTAPGLKKYRKLQEAENSESDVRAKMERDGVPDDIIDDFINTGPNAGPPRAPRDLGVWGGVDLLTVALGLAIGGFWLFVVQEAEGISAAVAALPAAPAVDASAADVQTYHEDWGSALDRLEQLLDVNMYHRLAMFWYTMLLVLHFIRAFRGQPHIAQLTCVALNAMEDVMHFSIVFLVLFLNFAFCGFMIWGLRLEMWSTGSKAVNTSFRALLGDVDLPAMYSVAPMSTLCWYFLFFTSLVLVMLNLLIAITFDHYRIVKDRVGSSTGVLVQVKQAAVGTWNSRSCCRCLRREKPSEASDRCCMRCIRCFRRKQPPHEEMLEVLMASSGYSEAERVRARNSVVGPKSVRRERERLLFAGELSEAACAAALGDVEPDLFQMELEDAYIDYLRETAVAHARRELDTEETRQAQMRELISVGEAEMMMMRQRLAKSRKTSGRTMRHLARQMEALEQAVHSSLAELVVISSTSGIADGAAKGSMKAPVISSFSDSAASISGMHSELKRRQMNQMTEVQKRAFNQLNKINEAKAKEAPPSAELVQSWVHAQGIADKRTKTVGRVYGKPK